jgi:acyl-coenzyme A synthetase/AMP-(fatty) acid ligase
VKARYQLNLQAMMSAGEAVGDAVFGYCQEQLGVTVNEMFGQTEINYVVGNCARLWPAKPGSMGKGYPGHQVAVIDDRGGYQYGQMSDGSFKILKSPLGGAGKIVRPGTKGYDAIKQHAESVRQLEAMYGSGDMARAAVESMNAADDVPVRLGSEIYGDGEPNAGRRPGPPAY